MSAATGREINAPHTHRDSKRTLPGCKHTPCPSGYIEWHEWAEKKARTHDQHRCPVCDGWAIWKRKAAGGRSG